LSWKNEFKNQHVTFVTYANIPFKESSAGIASIKINGRNNSRPWQQHQKKIFSTYILSQQGVTFFVPTE
jgi:hypothetical protein